MQIKIELNDDCQECQVIIINNEMNEEVDQIVKKLNESTPQIITGIIHDSLEIIDPSEIMRIYAQTGKVFITTAKGDYLFRQRLYEIEKRLDQKAFVRISHSEIINLKMVKNFDLSFTGTIGVKLTNGIVTYVSRRYVKTIKSILGI